MRDLEAKIHIQLHLLEFRLVTCKVRYSEKKQVTNAGAIDGCLLPMEMSK